MSKKNTPRHRLKRAAREQWKVKLTLMQQQTMQFIPDYAEGTDSNIKIAMKLQAINNMAEILKDAVDALLVDL